MEDNRIWEFERSLWLGDEAQYRTLVDEECVMVLPQPPFVISGEEAAGRVSDTPRWDDVTFSDQTVSRPQEGLIVIGYTARATREGGDDYEAHCTSTLRRLSHEEWRVVQHQQTPTPVAA
ncbi:DUF4440 domain-containing protein [Novosphingobium sp. FGD1]|jgi:hypothetical protein|uniref:DUF4440 domain-containing protein n=1 Tax=Novosphingobium silvae TaxID=2692619 RepID=A0A7X4GHX1_9SPHN|nr:DUF4440 domain-containing protein [Novosphingobium silvae]MYL98630.1 DUF4440 domain-containing protein [Novosphingobium silvae]